MADRLRLTDCTVGFCSDSQMPRWGQLGCNGFIVLDGSSQQRVVSRATAPFNTVQSLAFRHVEALIDAMIAGRTIPAVCPGQVVRLAGLQKASGLNNQLGLCVDTQQTNGRFPIQLLQAGRVIAVEGPNLAVVADPQAAIQAMNQSNSDTGQSGGCDSGSCGLPSNDNEQSGGGSVGVSDSNSCQPCNTTQERRKKQKVEEEEKVSLIQHVASVQVPEMDDEHEDCVNALNALATQRTRSSLSQALRVIEAHFQHEEKLLDSTIYASLSSESSSSSFSADASSRTTHFADHDRILGLMRKQLDSKKATVVSGKLIRAVMAEFEQHADRFDNYGDRLAVVVHP